MADTPRTEEQTRSRVKTTLWLCLGAAVLLAATILYFCFSGNPVIVKYRELVRFFSSRREVKAFLNSFGPYAPLVFIVLQALQVVLAPIPGEATGFLGGHICAALARAGAKLTIMVRATSDLSQVADYFVLATGRVEPQLAAMVGEARSYGMEPLVEVHGIEDVERAVSAGARLYAVNNRDKDTLKIDLRRTERLAPLIDGVIVSASGIETRGQLLKALEHCDAALIGSVLMKSPDPGRTLRSLVYGGDIDAGV
jgi:hypothetical protein